MKQKKQTFSANRLYPFLKSILTLLLLAGTAASLHAQPNMNANGLFYRYEYDGDGFIDLTIPNVSGQEVFFVLNGGDGGRRVVPGLCKVKGGEGATVQAAFAVGTGPGRLNPGGVIRLIPGERGENNRSNGVAGGGGGGGTGILYKAPGANITCDVPSLNLADASSCWVLLGVAGGGGGAYSSGLCGGAAGKGGNDGTQGRDGGSSSGLSSPGSGGTNGEGGRDGGGAAAGGGYLTDGLADNGTSAGGRAGKFEGGNGDISNQNGGFGYGGGGGAAGGGGGGGGFSGGGGGGEAAEGGGGGSFANSVALYSEKQAGGTKTNPKDGYVEYQFRANSTTTPIAVCKTITVEVDENGTVVIDAAQLDGGSFDPNGDPLDFCILSIGLIGGSSCEETRTFDCQTTGDEFPLLLAVSDGESGSFCSATVIIEDNDAPVITCRPTLEITLGEAVDATVTLTPEDLLTSSFDNCAITAFTLSQSTFSCSSNSDIGTHTVTLTAEDNDSNFSSCTTEVTINRFTVDCAPDFSATVPDGECEVWIDVPVFTGELGCGYFVRSQICKVSEDLITGGTEVVCSDFTTEDQSHSGFYGPGEYFKRWRVISPPSGVAAVCFTYFTVEKEVPDPLDCVPDFSVTIPDGDCEAWVGIPPPYNAITCGDYLESRVCVKDDLDNCLTNLDGSDKSGNYGPGEYQVEWFLFQSDGAFVERCTTYFTVGESEVPTAVCQDITVALDASGNVSITAADVDGGSTYNNCGISSLSATPIAFDCTNVGPNSVTLTAEDASGNEANCTATVTVEDNIPPTLVCQDVTLNLDENGTASANPFLNGALVSQSDNCSVVGGVRVTGPNIYTCNNIGTFPIYITQDDPSGNETTCTVNITVQDVTPPTAVCSGGTIVNINATGIAPVDAAALDGGSTDNCAGTLTFSAYPSTFGCGAVGSQSVTLTVTDGGGNAATCNTTVEVVDSETPTAVCQDVTVQLDASGNAWITTADIDNGSNDACGIANLVLDDTAFDCSEVGTNTVTLTVTDVNNQVSTCTATVTVEDNVAPNAICQNATVQLDASGNGSITAGDVDGGSNDACGIANLTVSPNTFGCSNVGANTVTLTVTDVNNQVSTCTATVTVEDNVAPNAICQNATVQLDASGNGSITAGDVDGGSNDACGIANLTVSPNTFGCSNVGANTVTLTVTDVNGNPSTCTATVTVEDNVAPMAICQNTTVQLDGSGNGSITTADIDNGSNDACGIANLTVSLNTFGCSNVGANTVTLTVTDVNGNPSTCTATVTVEDNVDPVAVCQNTTVQLDASGNGSITAGDVDGGSNDACGIANLIVSPNTFGCSNVGANTVTLTVTDVNGNPSTCTATVTVEDNVAPNAICQNATVQLDASGNGSITAGDVDGGSNDACGIANLTVSPNTFGCSNVGANTVTLTVTDVNGNPSTCTATVTVEDNVAPMAICQNTTVQLDGSGNGSITTADIDNGSNDACGIASLSLSQTAFTCAEVGANTVTLTVTDNNGNPSICTGTVTVEDNIDPVINCPGPIVTVNDQGQCGANVAFDVTASDNCGEVTVVCTIGGEGGGEPQSECATNNIDLSITFDNYPQETSWMIMDKATEMVVASGGTYGSEPDGSTIDIPLNLPEGLYVFVIMDSAGDGICCGFFGDGSYTLSSEGDIIATGGEFFDKEQVMFCVETPVDDGGDMPLTEVQSGDFFPVGTTTVTCTVTDGSGHTDVCTFDITVNDAEAPMIDTPCPESITRCGAQNVSWTPPTATDNCGVVQTDNNYNPGDFFEVGVYTVTYTFYDEAGLSVSCSFVITINPVPEVEISQEDLPLWCQGIQVLTANVLNPDALTYPLTFEWSDGLGGDPVVVAPVNGTYSVIVTDALGCSTEVSTLVDENISELFSAYTIISGEELEMYESDVIGGGVGIEDADEAEISDNSNIFTFLRADADNVSVDGTSFINEFIDDDFEIDFPPFMSNPFVDNNNITVPANTTMTLTGSNYGYVKVGSGATLIIDVPQVYLQNLATSKDATIVLTQPTDIMIRRKLNIGESNVINPDGYTAVIYVSDNASIGQGSEVTINIYAPEGLEVNDSGASLTTYMTGIFISNDGVNSDHLVVWNWNLNCSFLEEEEVPVFNLAQPTSDGPAELTTEKAEAQLNVYPNPTSGVVNVEVEGFMGEKVEYIVYDSFGKEVMRQVVDQLELPVITIDMAPAQFANGMYQMSLKGAEAMKTVRFVLTK